eukprot:31442-Pelagococcus_subviridis.AAC.13
MRRLQRHVLVSGQERFRLCVFFAGVEAVISQHDVAVQLDLGHPREPIAARRSVIIEDQRVAVIKRARERRRAAAVLPRRVECNRRVVDEKAHRPDRESVPLAERPHERRVVAEDAGFLEHRRARVIVLFALGHVVRRAEHEPQVVRLQDVRRVSRVSGGEIRLGDELHAEADGESRRGRRRVAAPASGVGRHGQTWGER